jgi:ElaB/YqjD/DUF883 family membrane-anchored ribosome-binding protein
MKDSNEPVAFIDQAAQRAHHTVTQLRDRAAQMEQSLRESTSRLAGSTGAGMDLANIEGSVQSIMDYIRRNPVAATLVALGAGVVVTAMWNEQFGGRTRRSRRRR